MKTVFMARIGDRRATVDFLHSDEAGDEND
jgi:hypothetical protein